MKDMIYEQPDVVCIGQALVDCITQGKEENPHRKNVYRAESITLNTGGDALNESIILSNLGHSVRLVCGIGDDLAGQLVLHTAKKNKIDTSFIEVSHSLSTPIANLMVDEKGNRHSINSYATKLEGYRPNPSAVKNAKIVSFASLFRAPIDHKDVIIDLMRAAKEAGAIICTDTKMPTYYELSLEDIKDFLPYIDYIFPNENEASYYTGYSTTDYEKMCHFFCENGVKNTIIKAGIDGSYIMAQNNSVIHVPAQKVNAIDSTGAGDNYVSGFIHGILNGWNLEACAEFGTKCAAISVQYVGAVNGIISHCSK